MDASARAAKACPYAANQAGYDENEAAQGAANAAASGPPARVVR